MLNLQDVVYSYRGAPGSRGALDGVSASITRGVTALLGVNGAGKSTLLRVAAGASRPDEGNVLVDGEDLYARRTRKRCLRKAALMPQSAAFPPGMTAREVVEYICWMRGASSKGASSAAIDALDRVRLTDRRDDPVGKLSGGMQRRVGLAQAIASGAEVLLLDEPSTGLDPEQRRVMVEILADLDGTVLLSSHVMEDVVDLAQRILVIDDGGLVFDGTTAQLQALAPDPAGPRAAEDGFLAVLAGRRAR